MHEIQYISGLQNLDFEFLLRLTKVPITIKNIPFAFIYKALFYVALANFFLLFNAKAQDPSLINYSIHDGLPSNEVYQIHLDAKGFLWFATDNGVARFDGKEFEKFNVKDSLTDPVVFGFHEDPKGRIWFRTFTGKLAYYNQGKVHPYPHNNITTSFAARAIITDLQADSLNNVWLSVGNFIKIDSLGNIAENQSIEPDVLEFKFPSGNQILAGASVILKRIKKIKIFNSYYDIQLSDTTQWLQSCYTLTYGNKIYFAINSDIFEYSKENVKKVYTGPASIISLSRIENDEVWIGFSNHGVIKTSLSDFQTYTAIDELKDKSISKVLRDQEDGYWIATLEKGVYYIPNFDIQSNYFKTSSRVRAVGYANGYLLIGDYGGNLAAEDPHRGKTIWLKKFNSAITSLYIDADSSIWVSHLNGTSIFNKTGNSLRSLKEASFIDFSQDRANRIWGFNSYGLHLFSKEGDLIKKKRLDTWHRNIATKDNFLFISGRNGLHLYDTLFTYYNEITDFRNYKISKVLPIRGKFLLITTTGNGFYLWNKELQKIFYSSSGNFISDNVNDVINVNSAIWIATGNGIAICSEKSLLKGMPAFDFITMQNGLISNKINQLVIGEDKIFAISDEGYSIIPEKKTQFINLRPLPYLKYFLANEKTIDISKELAFPKRENDIQISIGFLSYNNQNIYSRFRINKNNPWTITENRIFQFSSLDEGDYLFELEYSIDNFNWVNTPIKIAFTILPPWWGTWFFRAFVALLLLFLGVMVYKRRVVRYKEKNTYLTLLNEQQKKLLETEVEATERERSRIAKDLHDGISIDLVSIRLITDRIARKVDSVEALEVETQVQKTIAEIRSIIHGLNPPGLKLFGLSVALSNYLEEVKKKYLIYVTYDFLGQEIKNERVGTMIFRIIQELVTNSIKHSQCQSINLYLNVFTEIISIAYSDDGKGFNPDLVSKGFGLSNIESRVNSLEGKLNFESGEFGTTYSIEIPIRPETIIE